MNVEQLLTVGRALSDPTRISILLAALDGIDSPTWIAAQLGFSNGTITHHLAVLQKAGLIERRKRGTLRIVMARHDRWREIVRAAAACADPLGGQPAASVRLDGE